MTVQLQDKHHGPVAFLATGIVRLVDEGGRTAEAVIVLVAAGALVLECFSLVGQDDLGGFDKGRGLGELVLSFGIFLPLIVEDGHGAIGMVFLVGRSGSKKDLVHVPGDIQPVQAGDRKMLGDRIQTEDMLDLRASPILIVRYHGPTKNGGLGKGIDLVK